MAACFGRGSNGSVKRTTRSHPYMVMGSTTLRHEIEKLSLRYSFIANKMLNFLHIHDYISSLIVSIARGVTLTTKKLGKYPKAHPNVGTGPHPKSGIHLVANVQTRQVLCEVETVST
jgi:hypothetical protein